MLQHSDVKHANRPNAAEDVQEVQSSACPYSHREEEQIDIDCQKDTSNISENVGYDHVKTRLVEINKELYEADSNLLQKYQEFSSELTRLSLAIIAGNGFFISSHFSGAANISGASTQSNELLFGFICFIFALCAIGFALLHRFFSGDGLAEHIACIRYANLGYKGANKKAAKLASRSNFKYKICSWFLVLSAILFFTATIFFVLAVSIKLNLFPSTF